MIKSDDLIALVDACLDQGMTFIGQIVGEIRQEEWCDIHAGVDQACYALSLIEGRNKAQAQKILEKWRTR